jgi:hypothetical protein
MTRISVRANTGAYVRLQVMDCPTCGVIFGVDSTYDARRSADGANFYCPNRHSLSYTETEADRLKKETDRLRARMLAEMDQAEAARREAAAAKASEVRLRWRVGNGVCPCCSRTFAPLAAHVASKHPEFLTDDLDRLSTRMRELLAAIRAATEAEDVAVVNIAGLPGGWNTVRALERRNLVTTLDWGHVALTEHGWPLAEQAAKGASR